MNPAVSVVMSVFNGEKRLAETLQSMLDQTLVDFEFIAVNDGSADRTAEVLDDFANKDGRLRVVHQENTGLTQALIRGCSLARGEFIARQDASDVSLPERLWVQVEFLVKNPDVVMVAAGADFLLSSGEHLYRAIAPGASLDSSLRRLSGGKLRGPPHHGATIFRRSAYQKVGGYRSQFRVAQDIDLWLRLSELGQCLGTAEVLYKAVIESNAISINRHSEQIYYQGLAVQSAKLRRRGKDDAELFLRKLPPPARVVQSKRRQLAAFNYFVASCLGRKNSSKATAYLNNALQANPFHLKARLLKFAWSIR